MDLLQDEEISQDYEKNYVLSFTEIEYTYLKNLLEENYKLMCHFPKSKRTPNFYLFQNILETKFDL